MKNEKFLRVIDIFVEKDEAVIMVNGKLHARANKDCVVTINGTVNGENVYQVNVKQGFTKRKVSKRKP